jgi:hypothetical protein
MVIISVIRIYILSHKIQNYFTSLMRQSYFALDGPFAFRLCWSLVIGHRPSLRQLLVLQSVNRIIFALGLSLWAGLFALCLSPYFIYYWHSQSTVLFSPCVGSNLSPLSPLFTGHLSPNISPVLYVIRDVFSFF